MNILILIGAVLLVLFIALSLPLVGWWISRGRGKALKPVATIDLEDALEVAEITRGWALALDDTQAIDMSDELVEGTVTKSLPDLGEQYFLEDPLNSYSLPAFTEDWLPMADTVVSDLIELGVLTGIGADIDTEWRSWYEQDLVAA